jgi:hypothetical protein
MCIVQRFDLVLSAWNFICVLYEVHAIFSNFFWSHYFIYKYWSVSSKKWCLIAKINWIISIYIFYLFVISESVIWPKRCAFSLNTRRCLGDSAASHYSKHGATIATFIFEPPPVEADIWREFPIFAHAHTLEFRYRSNNVLFVCPTTPFWFVSIAHLQSVSCQYVFISFTVI